MKHSHKNLCEYLHIYRSFFFVVAKTYMERKCPSIDEWLNGQWYINGMELHGKNMEGTIDTYDKLYNIIK